tara:strand:- start:198 stop:1088 length:891 start_codon:yes stop_codon:yes gene_type:complete
MGIFSTKNKFKMDALRIKERGNKNTPTNFAESAVEFMKGMPGYYPQDHEEGHPSEREERRPDIASITEDDIINKQVVERDGGKYITGQVKVDGGSRPDTGGSYEKVYDKFETNEMGQKVNPTTGATYNSVEEFIEDAKESDKKEGYGEQIYDVDRKVEYGKNWSSSFWTNYDPIAEEKKMQNPRYKSKKAMRLHKFFINRDKNVYELDGRRTTRSREAVKALTDLGYLTEENYNPDMNIFERRHAVLRAYDQLILQDPDEAERLYRRLDLPMGRGSGKTRSYSQRGSDTGYRYKSD